MDKTLDQPLAGILAALFDDVGDLLAPGLKFFHVEGPERRDSKFLLQFLLSESQLIDFRSKLTKALAADLLGHTAILECSQVSVDGLLRLAIAVAAAVRESFEKAGIEVVSSESVSVRDEAAEGHLGPIIMILVAIAVAMAVVGCIGLASTMSTNVLERTREFGVMHAIGAQPKAVRRVVTAEGIFLALASCMAAIIPTLILTRLMGMGSDNLFMYAPLPFRVSPIATAIWIAVVCLGAVLATEAAASRASRPTVREALSYL